LNAPFPDIFSLVHVDYRLDNLMIRSLGDDTTITAVDWQSLTLGPPMNDVAYFIGAGLEPDVRAPVEEELVRGYYQGLIDAGVSDFSWDDCWLGYRRGAFAGFAVTVIASMLVQRTERGDTMFTTMARRHARHAIDLGSAEFLS
jgi:aminoglycoside phosphotransferase (APT) family kinase protein